MQQITAVRNFPSQSALLCFGHQSAVVRIHGGKSRVYCPGLITHSAGPRPQLEPWAGPRGPKLCQVTRWGRSLVPSPTFSSPSYPALYSPTLGTLSQIRRSPEESTGSGTSDPGGGAGGVAPGGGFSVVFILHIPSGLISTLK